MELINYLEVLPFYYLIFHILYYFLSEPLRTIAVRSFTIFRPAPPPRELRKLVVWLYLVFLDAPLRALWKVVVCNNAEIFNRKSFQMRPETLEWIENSEKEYKEFIKSSRPTNSHYCSYYGTPEYGCSASKAPFTLPPHWYERWPKYDVPAPVSPAAVVPPPVPPVVVLPVPAPLPIPPSPEPPAVVLPAPAPRAAVLRAAPPAAVVRAPGPMLPPPSPLQPAQFLPTPTPQPQVLSTPTPSPVKPLDGAFGLLLGFVSRPGWASKPPKKEDKKAVGCVSGRVVKKKTAKKSKTSGGRDMGEVWWRGIWGRGNGERNMGQAEMGERDVVEADMVEATPTPLPSSPIASSAEEPAEASARETEMGEAEMEERDVVEADMVEAVLTPVPSMASSAEEPAEESDDSFDEIWENYAEEERAAQARQRAAGAVSPELGYSLPPPEQAKKEPAAGAPSADKKLPPPAIPAWKTASWKKGKAGRGKAKVRPQRSQPVAEQRAAEPATPAASSSKLPAQMNLDGPSRNLASGKKKTVRPGGLARPQKMAIDGFGSGSVNVPPEIDTPAIPTATVAVLIYVEAQRPPDPAPRPNSRGRIEQPST
ncbi:hypothetical protein RUND412_011360 [Rhizina undulata]